MRAVQRTLLHFAAYNALLLGLYPLIAMIYHYAGASAADVWLSELYAALTGWAALFHAVFVRRIYRKKPVLVNIGFFAAGALFAAGAFILSPFSSDFIGVISAAAIFAVYQAGARLFFIEYDYLTHTYVYAGVSVLFALTSAVIWIGDHQASFLWHALLFLIISAVFSIARNFSGIDTALQSQGDDSAPLPKGLLKYNRLLLCVLGAVVFILVLLRKYIGSFLWIVLRTVVQCIGKVFGWFIGFFAGEEQEAAELSETPAILTQTAVSRNELVNLICTLVLAGIIIFLLVRYRSRIISAIVGSVRSIRMWIARIFGRSYEKQGFITDGGYTDYHMELPAGDLSWKDNAESQRIKWSREYRRFSKMKQSAEKYRFGYSLLLYKLESGGISVRKWETPADVQANIPPDNPYRELLCAVTSGYESVRYNENMPDEGAFEALETVLREKF